MRQQTLAEEGFGKFRKPARREQFLGEMGKILRWEGLCEVIEPFYPKPKGAGRRPVGLKGMLRIQFRQHWFNLFGPGVEEVLCNLRAKRRLVGIDLGHQPTPYDTTAYRFCHLLGAHNLTDQLFALIAEYLEGNGLKVSAGAIVDATIIDPSSSTKNKDGKRDLEMHQVRKGDRWSLGMKAHIGVDSKSKLIHSNANTGTNAHDGQLPPGLLHGNEKWVCGDSAYAGQGEAIRKQAPRAKDFAQQKGCRWRAPSDEERARNHTKSRVLAKVEHPFLILKRGLGFSKIRYRGLDKNASRLFVSRGLIIFTWQERCCCDRRGGSEFGVRRLTDISGRNDKTTIQSRCITSIFRMVAGFMKKFPANVFSVSVN